MPDTPLTTQELNARLMELDGWSVGADGKSITKTFTFDGFGAAMRFVNRVAAVAEQRNHHPDLDLRYDKVVVTLSTHSAGGVTDKDLELATLIDGTGL